MNIETLKFLNVNVGLALCMILALITLVSAVLSNFQFAKISGACALGLFIILFLVELLLDLWKRFA